MTQLHFTLNTEDIKEYYTGDKVLIYLNSSKIKELPLSEFKKESKCLLDEINNKSSKGRFQYQKQRVL